ncbi:MAG: DUF4397 domain-containing protein [Pseudomonadota bacterium]
MNTTLAGRFDVYLTGPTDSLDDTAATALAVSGGSGSTATKLAGSYRMRIANSGSKTDIRLDIPNITLANKGIYAIILTDTDGGVLVNAVFLPKQGQPTYFDNTASANVRVLNMSTGYSPIDLFTTDSNTTTSTETQQFTGSSMDTNTITPYSPITADTYTLLFRKHLATGNLTAQSQTFSETSYTTLVTYGTTNHFAVLPILENADAANDGYTKLQVYNTSSGDALDVYLSGPNDAITDISPTVAAIQPGTQAADTIVVANTYRLRVTLAGSKTDIRLDYRERARAAHRHQDHHIACRQLTGHASTGNRRDVAGAQRSGRRHPRQCGGDSPEGHCRHPRQHHRAHPWRERPVERPQPCR